MNEELEREYRYQKELFTRIKKALATDDYHEFTAALLDFIEFMGFVR